MQNKKSKRKVASKNLLARPSELRQGEVIDDPEIIPIPTDEKMEVEVREVFRILAQDLRAFKNSLEEFSQKWE